MKFSIRNKKSWHLPFAGMSGVGKWVAVLAVALFPFIAFAVSTEDKAKNKGEDELSMREVFARLQTPGLEVLGKSARLDMADYLAADSVHVVVGALGGAAWIQQMTDDYLKVRVSPVSTVELKILPLKNKRIVACVYTVGDSVQARDSEIQFYDSSLRLLDKKKFFRQPELADFFTFKKDSPETFDDIREMIPFPTVAYMLSPTSNDLRARLTVEDYISPDDVPTVKKYLTPALIARWKGRYRFK